MMVILLRLILYPYLIIPAKVETIPLFCETYLVGEVEGTFSRQSF